MSEKNRSEDYTQQLLVEGMDLFEASLFRHWRPANVKETAESLDDFTFVAYYFLKDWKGRKRRGPAPWDAELVNNFSSNAHFYEPDSYFDEHNFLKLYLWEHMKVWRKNIRGVEREFINGVFLPEHRTSQIFLIDFLVHSAWRTLTPAQSWKFFKTLVASDDWDFKLASKASLVFSAIEDYPVGWWPPLLEELVPGNEWRNAWEPVPL